MGKPSVRFRKVVNTTTDDGQLVAVTAQQYCVLVMDVPDLEAAAKKQHEREVKAANKVAWWRRWGRQTGTHTDGDSTPSTESSEDVEAGRTGTQVPHPHGFAHPKPCPPPTTPPPSLGPAPPKSQESMRHVLARGNNTQGCMWLQRIVCSMWFKEFCVV